LLPGAKEKMDEAGKIGVRGVRLQIGKVVKGAAI
jgi:hypothetical protein